MNLIDRDKIDDYLGEWAEEFYKKAENADADFMDGYCMTINKIQSSKVPTVEAIPVKFIIKKSRKLIMSGQFDLALQLDSLIDDWMAERKEE